MEEHTSGTRSFGGPSIPNNRVTPRLDDLIGRIRSEHTSELDQLSAAALTAERLQDLAGDLVWYFVDQARRSGASWTNVEQVFVVTKSTVRKRHVSKDPVSRADAAPAVIMAQAALLQSIAEVSDYLDAIKERTEDLLRMEADSTLTEMVRAGLAIDEALTIREHPEVFVEAIWERVSPEVPTVVDAQTYILRRLRALARYRGELSKVGVPASLESTAQFKAWLALLARCFQLQDALAVLDLDRALTMPADEMERHRFKVNAARRFRTQVMARSTRMLDRLASPAGPAINTAPAGDHRHRPAGDISDLSAALLAFRLAFRLEE